MANVSYAPVDVLVEGLKRLGPTDKTFISVGVDGKLVAGPNPIAPSHYFDFGSEDFQPIEGRLHHFKSASDSEAMDPPPVEGGRATGLYTVEIRGNARTYRNLKQVLRETLLQLSNEGENFLENVARERARTRGLIARTRDALFDNRHLADKHAEQLPNGWWLNTNNSAEQVKRWLRIMARHAGLVWNSDIRISF